MEMHGGETRHPVHGWKPSSTARFDKDLSTRRRSKDSIDIHERKVRMASLILLHTILLKTGESTATSVRRTSSNSIGLWIRNRPTLWNCLSGTGKLYSTLKGVLCDIFLHFLPQSVAKKMVASWSACSERIQGLQCRTFSHGCLSRTHQCITSLRLEL